jgi:hypothetical protein
MTSRDEAYVAEAIAVLTDIRDVLQRIAASQREIAARLDELQSYHCEILTVQKRAERGSGNR